MNGDTYSSRGTWRYALSKGTDAAVANLAANSTEGGSRRDYPVSIYAYWMVYSTLTAISRLAVTAVTRAIEEIEEIESVATETIVETDIATATATADAPVPLAIAAAVMREMEMHTRRAETTETASVRTVTEAAVIAVARETGIETEALAVTLDATTTIEVVAVTEIPMTDAAENAATTGSPARRDAAPLRPSDANLHQT